MPAFMSSSSLSTVIAKFAHLHPQVALSLAFSDQKIDPINDGFDVNIRVGWLSGQRGHPLPFCLPRNNVGSLIRLRLNPAGRLTCACIGHRDEKGHTIRIHFCDHDGSIVLNS